MKPLKAKDLRKLTNDELKVKYNELKNKLFEARIKKTFGQLEDTASIRIIKRNIAKILTILNERGIKI
ncbi:MAG: 50S ribosomal protein L29 [candidate division WOR-3 bacterium]|nr:50S ribosomal protein L29 [candidate division WOR-3 bacterium]MDW8150888.1 50S ribosomal protein L29 [candidate division WOR-3 bacterium]